MICCSVLLENYSFPSNDLRIKVILNLNLVYFQDGKDTNSDMTNWI